MSNPTVNEQLDVKTQRRINYLSFIRGLSSGSCMVFWLAAIVFALGTTYHFQHDVPSRTVTFATSCAICVVNMLLFSTLWIVTTVKLSSIKRHVSSNNKEPDQD